jgi:regulation of enolase protein 1 (concanavalin A-like superfamily)
MLRDGLGAGAAHVILNVKPGGDVEFMQRMSPSGDTAYLAGGHVSLPSWLRLTRDGSMITGSVSPDGLSWTTIGVAAASFGANVEAGLAVTSHEPTELNTARFSGPGVMPAPWIDRDLGTTGLVGDASFNDGILSVKAAGSDIWSDADSFHYVYRPMPAAGSITARVLALENTHVFAKAGVMIRETPAADSAHVILDVKPDGLIEFMQRSATGGPTTYLAGGVGPWLRLERAGAEVIASTSQDGATWTVIGSTTAAFSNGALVGIAVTSHDSDRLTSAIVDQVVVEQ